MFSPKCPKCGEAILDKCISAMDETWHPGCFVCDKCEADFGDDGFHEMKGKAFCKGCFQVRRKVILTELVDVIDAQLGSYDTSFPP